MAGHKALNGVAAGMLSYIISRNNDLGGYWAIGKLCRYAAENELSSVTIDLQNRSNGPKESVGPTEVLARRLQWRLANRSELAGFAPARITHAELTITFAGPGPGSPLGSTEQRFDCVIQVVDDHGRIHSCQATGRCRPHDPKFEQRSLRSDQREETSRWKRIISWLGGMKSLTS